MQTELDAKAAQVARQDEELAALQRRLQDAEAAKTQLASSVRHAEADVVAAAAGPNKAAQQLALVNDAHALAQQQYADAAKQLEARDGALVDAQAAIRDQEDTYTLQAGEVERLSYAVEAWEHNLDTLQKEVATKQLENEQVLAARVRRCRCTMASCWCCASSLHACLVLHGETLFATHRCAT